MDPFYIISSHMSTSYAAPYLQKGDTLVADREMPYLRK